MRDLATAGRAVVETPASQPTPVDAIVGRGRRRRHRRASLAVALATVVVAGGTAIGVAVARRPGAKVAIQPPDTTVTDVAMRAHLGLDVPKGWMPVDEGDARLFVPPSWARTAGGCPTGRVEGWIDVGGPYKEQCLVTGGPLVQVQATDSAIGYGGPPLRVVHGYELYRSSPGTAGDYVVPALHVTIHAEGGATDAVLATLAPSSRLVATTYRAAIDADWQPVTYAGLRFSAPPSWPKTPAKPACPPDLVTPETIALGTAPPLGCGAEGTDRLGPAGDGVAVSDPRTAAVEEGRGLGQTPVTLPSGAKAFVGGGRDVLTLTVEVGNGFVTDVRIGLGRDGRVAALVFASLRVDPASVPHPIVVPDVVGDAEPDAVAALQRLGFRVEEGFASSTTVASGIVVRQDPPPGTRFASGPSLTGPAVTITISNGPAGG